MRSDALGSDEEELTKITLFRLAYVPLRPKEKPKFNTKRCLQKLNGTFCFSYYVAPN